MGSRTSPTRPTCQTCRIGDHAMKPQISRRELLQRGALTTGASLAAGMIPVHAEAISKPRRIMANDKIVLGLIGCGGMGSANMHSLMEHSEVQVAALCDVDDMRMPNDIKDVERKYSKRP